MGVLRTELIPHGKAWTGLPGGSAVRSLPANRKCEFDPAAGRSPGEGNGNPLQDSCLGNLMDRGAWRVHGVTKESDMT